MRFLDFVSSTREAVTAWQKLPNPTKSYSSVFRSRLFTPIPILPPSEFHGDFLGVHAPREVGGLGATDRDDAGNSEAGGEDGLVLVGEEFAEDGVEAGVARAGGGLFTDEGEFAPDDMEEGDVRLRAADVAGEDQVRTRGHFQRSSS